MPTRCELASLVEERLLQRNQLCEAFFAREAGRLAVACREMSERFLRGGRLLAFGRGPYATDAQHVSVEFVHPVIVGKRALPALDLSILFRPWMESILRPEDIVMGFGPPEGDVEVWATLQEAYQAGAMTFALPGSEGSYAVGAETQDAFIHQEMTEMLYHTLWETVHVFFEHRELGHELGDTAFLYPFLGQEKQETGDLLAEVATSIQMKVHDDSNLRARLAAEQAEQIGETARAIRERLQRDERKEHALDPVGGDEAHQRHRVLALRFGHQPQRAATAERREDLLEGHVERQWCELQRRSADRTGRLPVLP